MFWTILFVVISSLLVVSPTVAKLSVLRQPESRDLPTRVRRGKILLACASVVSLPVGRRRVVDLEEELQQVAEARLTRVEHDLDRFCVRAVVAVRGVLDVAARVPNPR